MHIVLVDNPPLIEAGLLEILGGDHRVTILNGQTLDVDACSAAREADVLVQGLAGQVDSSELIDRATRGTWNLMTSTRARALVQLSTMRLFEAYSAVWAIDESWTTRPTSEAGVLASHLAEITSREIARSRPIDTRVLRLDGVMSPQDFESGPPGDHGLHLYDALTLIQATIFALAKGDGAPSWRVLHGVRGGGRYPLGAAARDPLHFAPAHIGATLPVTESEVARGSATDEIDLSEHGIPAAIRDLPPARHVTVYGAGGPLGATVAAQVKDAPQISLTLTDIHPLAHFAHASPQSVGAPRPVPPRPPHTEQVVDVTDPDQVLRAAVGADCLVNCAVVRHEVTAAFRVNVLGAYNVMSAAVALGIRRVVHTGPAQVLLEDRMGCAVDRRVAGVAPPRSGDNLYFVTKLLAQEVCRVLAEHHQIACPILLFADLLDPDTARSPANPFSISWADAGRAVAAAMAVEHLAEPAPVVHVRAPSPHGRYREGEIVSILGWEPVDRFDRLWMRPEAIESSTAGGKFGVNDA